MAGVKLKIDIPKTCNRFSSKFQKAQKWLDNEVLKDCYDYVPYRTGTLAGSGIRGTKIGSGKVVYNEIYAKSVYYARNRNFSKKPHPQASAQWFEKAKAVKKDDWVAGVNKIIKE